MISRSFERPDRTVSRASDARNRYKIRCTRTQHRPPSRHVNDHGRVSGTHRGPWRSVDDVELATLGWVHWHNTQLLHSHLGDIPPAEFEDAYSARQADCALVGNQ